MHHEHQETGGTPEVWVVWLHGLGASGHDFVPIIPWLRLLEKPSFRFLFPHAPEQPVTVNGGMIMPSWYDIHQLGPKITEDRAGMQSMAERLTLWLEGLFAAEGRRVPVVVGGFSQGGAMACFWAGALHQPCVGWFALSSYRACAQEPLAQHLAEVPAFVAHGTLDPVVPWAWAQRTWGPTLEAPQTTVCVREGLDHSVDQVEMEALGVFLHQVAQKACGTLEPSVTRPSR